MQIKRIIPNSLTCANLLCGSVSVFMATQQEFVIAFALIMAGAICDFFDGASARWLKVPSPLGVQLDSLADDITFGLAPSMILMCYLKPLIGWWSMIALLMAAFSALRLAKFNIDERQTTSFIGLATPPNAIFWGSLVCLLHTLVLPTWLPWVLLGGSLVSCYLLVCEIPFFSFKSAGKNRRYITLFLEGCVILLVNGIYWAIRHSYIELALVAGAACIVWYIVFNFYTLVDQKRK